MSIFNPERIVNAEIDGKSHKISIRNVGGRYEIYVDDVLTATHKPDTLLLFLGDLADYAFNINGHNAVLAMRFGKMKVAVDGKYVDGGKPHAEVLPLPKGAGIVFAFLNIIAPSVFRGDLWDYVIAACGVFLCTHFIYKNPELNATFAVRTLLCAVEVVIEWIILGFFCWIRFGSLPFIPS